MFKFFWWHTSKSHLFDEIENKNRTKNVLLTISTFLFHFEKKKINFLHSSGSKVYYLPTKKCQKRVSCREDWVETWGFSLYYFVAFGGGMLTNRKPHQKYFLFRG